jgi:phage tail sheath protein FI
VLAEWERPIVRAANPDTATIQRNLGNSDYVALYFPWIWVFDSATQAMHPDGDGEIPSAPSSHIAGIFSRVDHERGVHKAPANEVIRGALDLERHVSRSMQDGLNPYGIHCIRRINNQITVWGARTLGGESIQSSGAYFSTPSRNYTAKRRHKAVTHVTESG